MHALCDEHLEAMNRILRYLKITPGKRLFFGKRVKKKIEAFINVDWVQSIKDKRSTSRYYTFV